METMLPNKEIRMMQEIIVQDYKSACGEPPSIDYVLAKIYQLTGIRVSIENLINVKPFKKIKDKKVIIAPGKVIKVLRRRNNNNRHNHYKRV